MIAERERTSLPQECTPQNKKQKFLTACPQEKRLELADSILEDKKKKKKTQQNKATITITATAAAATGHFPLLVEYRVNAYSPALIEDCYTLDETHRVNQ